MAGLTNAVVFVKRMKKLNTDQVYRQRKYNLLHEESEGYSKVSTGVQAPYVQKKSLKDFIVSLDSYYAALTN